MYNVLVKFKKISNLELYSKCFKRNKSSVTIVEVGPRDGLQYEKVIIPLDLKVELINRLSDTGLKRIESGSFVNTKLVPQFIDSAQVFANIKRKEKVIYSALVPNVKGLRAAIEAKVNEIAIFGSASEQFSQKNINCSIDESFRRFKDVITEAHKHNLAIRGYLSCVVACPYAGDTNPKFVASLTKKMLDMGCFEVSLGDTIGVGTPERISAVLERCLEVCDADKLAIHCHDTNGQAITNILRAIVMGIRVVDSSIAGLGGCPFAGPSASGNVATEKVVQLLHDHSLLGGDIDRDQIVQVAAWIRNIVNQAKATK